jgi:hypothetical protein
VDAKRLSRLALFGLLGLILAGVGWALAAANIVPETGLHDAVEQDPVTPNDLKPPECAGLDLTNIVEGSGTFNGTDGNDLILGSPGADVIDGGAGDDCILGGDQNDDLYGGGGAGGTDTVRDEFNAVSYGNNDGTQSWSGDWAEIGESDGPASGDVNIEALYNLVAVEDSWIAEKRPDTNYGSDQELNIRLNPGNEQRAVFYYDLSAIPAGSNIISATAYFWVTKQDNAPVNVHRITDAWAESTVTWANTAADFDSTPDGAFTPSTRNQFVLVDVTALVQEWVDGASPNYGLMLIASGGNSSYASREAAGSAHDPYLMVVLPSGGSGQALRIQNAGRGAWRMADLSGALSAELRFDYHRDGLDDASDYVAVEVSNNGGSSWTELDRLAGPATDGPDMQSASYDISGYISGNTAIRFISSSTLGGGDRVRFDNVTISYTTPAMFGGNDVLLGETGDDILTGGDGTDVCTGGPGSNTYDASCETQN